MTHRIALVTRAPDEAEAEWLSCLRAALPEERITSLRALEPVALAEVDVAIVANPDPADLKRLPKLTWVHSLWAGVERLVAELGDFPHPIVRLVDPELARVMGEAALAWTFYLQRDMPAYARQQAQRIWRPLPYRAPGQVTVGVLGLGEMGQAAVTRLREAGFRVEGWSRSPKAIEGITCHAGEEGLMQLLPRADIVLLLLPLTAQTRGLLDAGRIAAMKPGAQVINFARGPIIDIPALTAALDRGHLRHAVLDVFAVEPLPAEDPLWSRGDVTILPHVSGPTNRETASAIVAANIRRWRATGALPPAVNMARGY